MNSSSLNSSAHYDALVAKSFATLIRTTPAAFGLIATGLLAMITNVIVVILIRRTDSLRTPSHFLISQLAIADWLVGASYFTTAIKRLIRLSLGVPEVTTQLNCCFEIFFMYFRYVNSTKYAKALHSTTKLFMSYCNHTNIRLN